MQDIENSKRRSFHQGSAFFLYSVGDMPVTFLNNLERYTRKSYHQLNLLHLFTANFGDVLSPMGTVLPEGWDKIDPTDAETLRYAVRKKGNSGFVFLNNFQAHTTFQLQHGWSTAQNSNEVDILQSA